MATVALSYYTAKVAHETEKEIHQEDSRIIRMLIRRNKAARHAKRQAQAEKEKQDNVRRLS
jgi:hypothetical protein